jgi:4-hydroxy-tetrahydrodipicolinate reductase
MKIAILGNGKMGRRISELATEKGHEIVITSCSENTTISLDLSIADVAIDFSTPTTALENISHAINSGIPVISGTTAWLEKLQDVIDLCISKKGAFLYASNFSLGMNIVFELNKKLAKLVKNQKYETKIHEIHHAKKLDSPSGTAKILSADTEDILLKEINITSDRIKDVPGIHTITYSSSADEIEIKHTAKNRDGFAMGAIIAAEWIIGRKGVFCMQDVLEQ